MYDETAAVFEDEFSYFDLGFFFLGQKIVLNHGNVK